MEKSHTEKEARCSAGPLTVGIGSKWGLANLVVPHTDNQTDKYLNMLENERVPKIPAYASLINGHCVSQALVKVCACFITDTENGPCLIRKMVELYKMLRLQNKKDELWC